jgi:hypothetical protein
MTPSLNKFVFLGAFLLAPSALASPSYPSVMEQELEMSCPPRCLVCHTTDPGEAGTASQEFASTLKSFGLEQKDDDSLKDALAQLQANPTDSDGDGANDIAELRADPPSDPNNAMESPLSTGRVGICDAVTNYGCGASIAGAGSRSPLGTSNSAKLAWIALAFTLGALGMRRLHNR